MATILFGPMVSGARGKIGGVVFSANKSGPYAKGWSRSSNPRTPAQQTVRDRLGSFSSTWQDLTSAQQDDWVDYADDAAQELTNSLGENYFISGAAWFIRINSHLDEAGAAARVDAPTLTRPVAPTIGNLEFFKTSGSTASRVVLTVGSAGLASNCLVTFRLFYSTGRQVASSGFRHMIVEVPNASRRLIIQDELESAYGTILEGVKGFCQVSIQDAHGQRGPIDTAFDVAAA